LVTGWTTGFYSRQKKIDFSALQSAQTGSETHPTSCVRDVKVTTQPVSSVEVKNGAAILANSPTFLHDI
jgi:hypothetical protein